MPARPHRVRLPNDAKNVLGNSNCCVMAHQKVVHNQTTSEKALSPTLAQFNSFKPPDEWSESPNELEGIVS